MRKYLLMLALLAVAPALLCAQVALVQTKSCGPQTFPTSSCTIASTGAGHLIVVGIQLGKGINTSTVIATITDDAGNAYEEATSAISARSVDAGGGSVVDIWYARNSQPGATTLTITPSATIASASAVIWEFSGVNTNTPLDQVGILNSQPATLNPIGAPVTTSNYAKEIVITLAAGSGLVSGILAGNAFSSDSVVNNDGWAHLITSSAGTYAAQWAQSMPGTFASSTASFMAANATPVINACDLNRDGAVNVVDVQLAVNMTPAVHALACSPTINVVGLGVCNILVVQQIVTAALTNVCTTASSHSVLLSWGASSTPGATYNVYRSSTSGGPYIKLTPVTPIAGLSYIDGTAFSGQTYYYVVTAVSGNVESGNSTEVNSAIPFP